MIYTEIISDLFTSPKQYMLVHCISKDKALAAGIAKTFRLHFPEMISKMENENFLVGNAYCYFAEDKYNHNKRIIANLVTKDKYYQKPTYHSLEQSLYSLKEIIVLHNVKNIAMPKIGCGLDKLEWNKVYNIIQKVFSDIEINIVVHKFS